MVTDDIFEGNIGDGGYFLHCSPAGGSVRGSVWHAVLNSGYRNNVDEYNVVSVGVQWQRDIQQPDISLCFRLQVSHVHQWFLNLPPEGTFSFTVFWKTMNVN